MEKLYKELLKREQELRKYHQDWIIKEKLKQPEENIKKIENTTSEQQEIKENQEKGNERREKIKNNVVQTINNKK